MNTLTHTSSEIIAELIDTLRCLEIEHHVYASPALSNLIKLKEECAFEESCRPRTEDEKLMDWNETIQSRFDDDSHEEE